MKAYKPIESEMVNEQGSPDNSLFFKKIMSKVIALWPWLIVSTVTLMALSILYLMMSSPQFKIHAVVLVQDDKKGSQFGDASLLQDMGILAGKSNVDNEVEVLKSRVLMEHVVNKLQLNIKYAVPDRLRSSEVFMNKPVMFRFIKMYKDSISGSVAYNIIFDEKKSTHFQLINGENTYASRFGDTLQLKEGLAIVEAATGFPQWPLKQPLEVTVSAADEITNHYMNALSIEIPNKDVSVIYLTLEETLPEKGETILNTIISEYILDNVTDKNKIADSTIKFIDDRMMLMAGELIGIEKEIEGFKTENKLTDIAEQSRMLIDNTSQYARDQTAQEVQLSVVEALENFLKQNIENARVVPSSLVMQDPSFIGIIQRYNEAQLQRDKMLMSLTPQHPSIITVSAQLQNLRQEMLSSIGSIKKGIQVSITELSKRTSSFEGAITKIPAQERKFLDISRQQAIKQELYLFLLKKREETAISKSSTIANVRIIDNAKSEKDAFKPKKQLIALAGFLAGILLPLCVSLARDFMNIRITSLQDITDSTHAPLLAEIGRHAGDEKIVMKLHSRNIISEQFRSLRTNLKYLLSLENEKTILITSSMAGEGKSFITTNLCASLAMAGKKVILMEFDLRKPKITQHLNLQRRGYTNYIISNDSNWKQWVQNSGIQENFDVFSSGPPPPNPAELLMLPKTAALFNALKSEYDYIIIDSPPVGLVTDAEIMSTFADATLYIVRHGFTFKNQINYIENLYQKKALPRINIVVNDVEFKKSQYGYGNGYSYSYGYGNYGDELPKKNKKTKKILSVVNGIPDSR